MKTEVKIRLAAPDDAGLIAELGRETFRDAFSGHPLMPAADLQQYLAEAFTVRQIASELNDPRSSFLLAEIDGETAGYAKLIADEQNAEIGANRQIKLKRLYSRQKFIGAGVGAELIKRCLSESARGGYDAIWLTVWEHNLRAQSFYRKWEFVHRGFVDFQLGRSRLRDFILSRAISRREMQTDSGERAFAKLR